MSVSLLVYLAGFLLTWPLVFRAVCRHEITTRQQYRETPTLDSEDLFIVAFWATGSALFWPITLLYLLLVPLFRRWADETIKREVER